MTLGEIQDVLAFFGTIHDESSCQNRIAAWAHADINAWR